MPRPNLDTGAEREGRTAEDDPDMGMEQRPESNAGLWYGLGHNYHKFPKPADNTNDQHPEEPWTHE